MISNLLYRSLSCLNSHFRFLLLLQLKQKPPAVVMDNSTQLLDFAAENRTRETNDRRVQFVKLMDISDDIMVYGGMVIMPVGIVLNLLTVSLF